MKKLVSIAAATVAAVPMLAMAAPVFADSPGQLQGGPNTYVVKNLTQSGSYAASAAASCNDTVQYSVELHNTEFGKLTGIVVKASLPSTSPSVSNMTATTDAGGTTGTNGSVTVSFGANQTLSYVAGSTQLFNGSGTLVKSLADGVAANGVNVGDLNGSTTEFVNFKAKVTCPTPPKECKPGIPVGDTRCNVTPPVTPPTTPTTLPNTGAGNVFGIVAGAIVAGFVGSRLVLSRKLARKA